MNRFYTNEQIRQMVAGADVETISEARRQIAKWCFCNEADREAARFFFWFRYGFQF